MTDPAFSFNSAAGKKEGVIILSLVGPLTLNTIFGFQNEFRAMRPPVLITDLSQVPYMDSAGLGLLMNQYVSAEGGGRRFLLAGVNARLAALFELTKVSQILKQYPTVEAAEAAV